MTDDSIATFQQRLRGPLVRQGDREYDTVRALFNGMIDRKPRLIARCVDVADVIAAVNFDRSGTTRIGKYVLNHSFMLPGLVATVVAVSTGLAIAKLFF